MYMYTHIRICVCVCVRAWYCRILIQLSNTKWNFQATDFNV